MSLRAETEARAALAAIEAEEASLSDKIEMLMEMAMGMQIRPKTPDYLQQAIRLYEKALELCPAELFLLRGRLHARLATALQALPAADLGPLNEARRHLELARDILNQHGTQEELAEIEMNLGVVLQSLSGAGAAPITTAIAAYQKALRMFDAGRFPKEYAILQNNLATAYLSIPFADERAKMREALAVQAFQEGLKVVNIIDHPTEYAMLQNNLGNALQYVSSSHSVENCLRAVDAYEEALKVRTRASTPAEYANTLSNYANCLRNLPDDVERPERGNRANLSKALRFYREATEIFTQFGEMQKAAIVGEMIVEIEADLNQEHGNEAKTVIVGLQ